MVQMFLLLIVSEKYLFLLSARFTNVVDKYSNPESSCKSHPYNFSFLYCFCSFIRFFSLRFTEIKETSIYADSLILHRCIGPY